MDIQSHVTLAAKKEKEFDLETELIHAHMKDFHFPVSGLNILCIKRLICKLALDQEFNQESNPGAGPDPDQGRPARTHLCTNSCSGPLD